MPHFSRVEWEGLKNKYNLGKYGPIKSELLPKGTNELEVFRDGEYRLIGKIRGKFDKFTELDNLNIDSDPGEFINYWNLEISDPTTDPYHPLKIDYELNDIVGNIGTRRSIDGNHFEYKFALSSIKRIFDIKAKVDWITEWFLNGPYGFIYPEVTEHNLVKKYKKKRRDINKTFKVEKSSTMHDYFHINFKQEEYDGQEFIIHSVPDIFSPSWSRKVGIEYRTEWGIPSIEERKKISEIVSFIFGRQLIKIGSTKFTHDGWRTEDIAYNPAITPKISLIALCKRDNTPPVEIMYKYRFISGRFTGTFKKNIDDHFKELIPKYLELRDELNLDEVLWRYWLSESLPSYAKLSVLAASFELLVDSWYKSKNSKIKGNFLPHDDFMNLFKEEFEIIKNKLENVDWDIQEFSDRFYNKIINSNQMGFNASIQFFFKELGLEIGKIEKEAIQYRNKSVHGHIISKEESNKLIICENTYKTLVNRTILKILNYDWAYIDYHTMNYPLRHIDEPIGFKRNTN